MALIKCPECAGNVSSAADACPHCGFPIKQSLLKSDFDKEITRLESKIKKVQFKYPAPRAKVCMKCAKPFYYGRNAPDGIPDCSCEFKGQKYPGVEIDFSNGNRTIGSFGHQLYIQNQCVAPRNIGDTESLEYKKRLSNLLEKVERANKRNPDRPVTETPPNKEAYNDPVDWSNVAPPPNSRPQPKSNTPQCPICKSTKLKKIAVTKKAAKISVFGIFGAGDLGKTWRCENCGSKF